MRGPSEAEPEPGEPASEQEHPDEEIQVVVYRDLISMRDPD